MKCKVIIIPEYPKEKTGHADGLVRFIDEKRVFINETNGDPEKEWLDYFLKVLKENKLEPFELPCQAPATQKAANGLYINYMHIGKLILVPQFKGYGDDNKEALKRIKGEFPKEYKVKPYPANWIAKYGGVFNCMSWNILA